jgi:hypothetical protein
MGGVGEWGSGLTGVGFLHQEELGA